MFRKLIEAAVEKSLDRRTVRPDRKLELEGYHPLPAIMGELYSWLLVPFRGAQILVEVRFPRAGQIPEVDKLYSIIGEGKSAKKLSRQQVIDIMNIQEECCRAVLNRPTFEELEEHIYGKDNVLSNRKKELAQMREELEKASGFAKTELKLEIDRLELFTGYILPDDTMVALTEIAYGIGVSDLKKMTKEKLVNAHIMAKMYKGRPSDYVGGLFTEGTGKTLTSTH